LGEFNRRCWVLCGLLALSGGIYADHEEAYQLLRQGKILPLGEIIALQRQERPGRILEVELRNDEDRLVYLIEVLDDQGRVWQLFYDAATGDSVGGTPEP
jgi:uncharacterized membrane protein YkoI